MIILKSYCCNYGAVPAPVRYNKSTRSQTAIKCEDW